MAPCHMVRKAHAMRLSAFWSSWKRLKFSFSSWVLPDWRIPELQIEDVSLTRCSRPA